MPDDQRFTIDHFEIWFICQGWTHWHRLPTSLSEVVFIPKAHTFACRVCHALTHEST